jgi:hypothetical protein
VAWDDDIAGLNGVILDTFGQAVTYIPATGLSVTINAVFDEAYQAVVLDRESGAQITTTLPALKVRISDLVTAPHVHDHATVAGTTYEVSDVRPDSSGMSALWLVEAWP